MPPKGSTKLAPPRLPPLTRLRVRRPNQANPNPCLGIMSSVLGIWSQLLFGLEIAFADSKCRLLGIIRKHRSGLCSVGAAITGVYGRTGKLLILYIPKAGIDLQEMVRIGC